MESVFLWIILAFAVGVLAILMREDWLFLTRKRLRVEGEVIRHDKTFSDGDDAWRAVFAFVDEEGIAHEVCDTTLFYTPRPDIGTRMVLTYPKGAAEKARVQRLILRLGLYLVVSFMAAVLVGRVMEWLPAGGW